MEKTYLNGVVWACFALMTFSTINAQVGIGTTTPDASAALDITSTNRGPLIPIISLTSTADTGTITDIEATGLMVFNAATSSNVTPGFYYWESTEWIRFDTNAWSTNGNAGTNPAVNFARTTEVLRIASPDGTNDQKIITRKQIMEILTEAVQKNL